MIEHESFAAALRPVQRGALLAGVVGSLLATIGYFVSSPASFYSAYLIAFLFWLGISLGALGVAMIHHLSGGGWGLAVRRILEAAYSVLPLMALLFVPLIFGLKVLYPWAQPEHVAHDEILQGKQAYLNTNGYLIRAAVYFALWIMVGTVLNMMSAGRDPAAEQARRRRLSLFSGPGLIVWCLSITFASVDWTMSLEPHWFSSMYGVLFMAGYGVAGLALSIIVLLRFREHPPLTEVYSLPRQHDLGNFLLAFILFWSYVSFSQYLIIWSANLPEETPWYLHRGRGGWEVVAIALIALHFVVPFLLLLWRQSKQMPHWLMAIAGLLLVMRYVDLYWLVVPAFSPDRITIHWLHLVMPVAIGGWWLAVFAWRLPARSALPIFELPAEEETVDDVAHQPAH
jgi:hypothetical protein